MWCSAALTAGGTTAFVLFAEVADVRCPFESVPTREWTLVLAALMCGLLGLVLFFVGWIWPSRAGRAGRRRFAWWLALLVGLPTYLLIPAELSVIDDLDSKHTIGGRSECFGQASGATPSAPNAGDLSEHGPTGPPIAAPRREPTVP